MILASRLHSPTVAWRWFDAASWVDAAAVAAAAVMLAHIAGWIAYVTLSHPREHWFPVLFSPVEYPPGGLATAATRWWTRRFATRRRAKNRHIQNSDAAAAGYELLNRCGDGDLSEIYFAIGSGGDCLVKVARERSRERLLLHEQRVLLSLRDGREASPYRVYLPRPLGTFRQAGRLSLALERRRQFISIADVRERIPQGLDGRHVAWIFNRMLEVLGHVHRRGWVNGAVLPPHLLVDVEQHSLQLIGWPHARPLGSPLRYAASRFWNWYPPECHQRRPATAATDIYLATRTAVWLAGECRLPTAMAGLFRSCLSLDPTHRPQDAWALHEQFRELLEATYGPPRFCRLSIP